MATIRQQQLTRRNECDPDFSALSQRRLPYYLAGKVETDHGTPCFLEEELSGFGQFDMAAGTFEQTRAQFILHRLDLYVERPLADVEPACGSIKALLLCHRDDPQSPGVDPATCIPELERCVKEDGFVAINLNPDQNKKIKIILIIHRGTIDEFMTTQ
jgi:hypothetical protein